MSNSSGMEIMEPGAPSELHLFWVELFITWTTLYDVCQKEKEQEVFNNS